MILSIIIPSYNSESFISATLDSLISQNLDNCEVIVVNDGSTDNTETIVQKYALQNDKMRLVNNQNQGVSVARNTGLMQAKGEFVCFLDSDDDFEPGTLDYFKKVLSERKGIDFFSFGYSTKRNGTLKKLYVCERLNNKNLSPSEFVQNFFLKNIQIHVGSFICRKSFLINNNIFFTKGLRQGEDVEFILNILKKFPKSLYLSRQSFIYQLRDNSVTCNYSVYGREHLFFFELWRDIVISEVFKTKQLEKHANFWLQNLLISHIITYIKYGEKDAYITEHLQNSCKILKQPSKFSANKNSLIVFVGKILPMKFLLGILK